MKYFFPMLCVVAAGGAGYVFEPKITPNLISDIKQKEIVTEVPLDGEKKPEKESALPKTDPTPVVAKTDPAPPPVAKVEPTPPAPVPTPPAPAPAVEPMPEPVVKTEPEPAPAPPAPPTPSASKLDEAGIVSAMQESIKSGKITEFTFEQVVAWKGGEEETVDGVTYQTGLAAFKKDTILGFKTMQAKALIKGGKIAKWVWKETGSEMN